MEKTSLMGKVRNFLSETMAELGRCTWPSRSELLESTVLVVSMIVLVAAFVAVVDQISRGFIRLITGAF